MRRALYLGVLACLAALAGWLTYQYNTGVSPTTNPEDGSVTSSAYTNAYFGLSYPLPSGWVEDVAGPGPSESGYYVLGSFVPDEELTALIDAGFQFGARIDRAPYRGVEHPSHRCYLLLTRPPSERG